MSEQSNNQATSNEGGHSVAVTLVNKTDWLLARIDADLEHGEWAKDQFPPDYISPQSETQSEGRWKNVADELVPHTAGYVKYAFEDAGRDILKVSWNNPHTGWNTYNGYIDGPDKDKYACSYTGGAGSDASVTFTLEKI
ncbi:hypothetical protein GYMLUDRAFT_63301 [Collybiopsis luxurians FD-317 M1]|uniref:Crystal protein ET79 n=1 Tax=Collybiopsis luxurians FD-317 M1 TaxID=944289 RepID=A0A0D0C8F4_9AGAR|nr:hypothetical protein GYMLUDRAFT_63301 [Collybiopsis luxurians FD-317 M1]